MLQYFFIFVVLLLIGALIYSIYCLIIALKAGKKRLLKKLQKANKLISLNKLEKAFQVLDRVLQDNGYNYRRPHQKKSILYRQVQYPDLEPVIFRLTEVLKMLGRPGNNIKIFEDMLIFISQLDEVRIGKGQIAAYKKKVYEKMAEHYFEERDYKSAIMNSAIAQVEEIKSLKILGKSEELKTKLPIKDNDLIFKSITKMGYEDVFKGLMETINCALHEKIEETTVFDVTSNINSFLNSIRESRRRKLAINEVKRVDEKQKKKTDKEEDKDVIIL